MLTKQEVVEMLLESGDIMNYQHLRNDFSTGKLYQLAQEDAATVMVRCIDAYDRVIQKILDKLDDHTSF